jgi:hypothetical protein
LTEFFTAFVTNFISLHPEYHKNVQLDLSHPEYHKNVQLDLSHPEYHKNVQLSPTVL